MASEYICCFTGHRNIDAHESARLPDVLDGVVDKLCESGVTVFRTGGAIGFDTLAALKVIDKKQKYPHIKLHLFLPCKNQTAKWNGYNMQAYEFIINNADEVTYTSEEYTKWCMLQRDRRMVDGAQFCVAYCYKSSGGTAYTLDYAKKQGLRVINIATMT
ncbi:MAG: DUF1273 domain-containing protein [Ruminococcaceae bacterium]|nr:DUF1273 domain-containing protein [Oscillospiraceae bacterium]